MDVDDRQECPGGLHAELPQPAEHRDEPLLDGGMDNPDPESIETTLAPTPPGYALTSPPPTPATGGRRN